MDTIPKAQEIKIKINLEYVEIENFCAKKGLLEQSEKATLPCSIFSLEWEKIFVNHVSDKWLTPTTYRELLRQQKKLIKKWAKD